MDLADEELGIGLLVTPATARYLEGGRRYRWGAVDNGCFTAAGRKIFDRIGLAGYLRLVDRALDTWEDNMLFATAPDVPFDWRATRRKSLPVLPQIRALGSPSAIVLQDGATTKNLPWDEFDVMFIGGSTEWKVGRMARKILRFARTRTHRTFAPRGFAPDPTKDRRMGYWVHMGRVNSRSRLRIAAEMCCNSVDGTFLRYAGGRAGWMRMREWLEDAAQCAATDLGPTGRAMTGIYAAEDFPDDDPMVRATTPSEPDTIRESPPSPTSHAPQTPPAQPSQRFSLHQAHHGKWLIYDNRLRIFRLPTFSDREAANEAAGRLLAGS